MWLIKNKAKVCQRAATGHKDTGLDRITRKIYLTQHLHEPAGACLA